ncbi:MAG TPA: hypothetical protein PKA33_07540 [Amaricoccus sp.]|nr:hypothetical protein [Amaricoccus sp.]HMQ92315.1 hypothetical protein [Amaricoccus sp.]HMR52284.1 hypothetical protein [Amaricoccus sp.]HMT99205.1 hypothetical protein [Amaricoccus sp.]
MTSLGACALVLAACDGSSTIDPDFIPSGGAVGREGSGFCHTVPGNPNDRPQWNNLCNNAEAVMDPDDDE